MDSAFKKRIWFLSLPIISELFVQQLYSVIDMTIVGRFVGSSALAAVGDASNILMIFLVGSGGLEMSIDVLVSRLKGAGKEKEEATLAKQTLMISFLSGLILIFISYLMLPWLLQITSTPKNLSGFAMTYGRIYLLGLPITYLYDVGRAILVANEKAQTSFYLLLTSSIINIILDLLFIVGLHWGVAGAASATVLAQGIAMIFTLLLVKKQLIKLGDNGHLPKLTWESIKQVFTIAIPTTFQQFAITFSATLIQAWVNPFGKEIILGYVAIVKIMNLCRIVIVGFAQTLTLLSAQLLPGKKFTELKQLYFYCVKASLIYALLVGIPAIICAKPLASLFFDPVQNGRAFIFFKTYLIAFLGIQIVSAIKFMNEGLLRSMILMKEYLYCNVGELVLKLILTYSSLPILATNAFWSSELLARIILVFASTYCIIHEIHNLKS